MNKLLYFVAGAIVGAGTSYFILKKKFKEELDREINDIINREIKEESKKQEVDVDVKLDLDKDYSQYDTSTKDIPEDVTIIEHDPELDIEESSEFIDENEYEDDYYNDDGELYEKDDIIYFFKNDLFTDSNKNPIEDLESYFNDKETIDKIKEMVKDDDYNGACYIRCHRLETDYMIVCDFRNYNDVVENDDISFN